MNLGKVLAQFAIDGAKTGKVSTEQARMCSGCAFKAGTPANGEKFATEGAMECLMSPGRMLFKCHKERERNCGGFMLAKAVDQ